MLEGLDEVPWARLTHAYGSAADVPDALRALARGDDDALSGLFGSIWHQGTVYEATAYAVPFLVDLLDVDSVDRRGVLGLLQAIANGASYLEAHQDLSIFRESRAPSHDEILRKELAWKRAAHDAVEAGVAVFLRLLADGDEGTRAAAAHTLASCRDARTAIVPALALRVPLERSEGVCASLLFALHDLGDAPRQLLRAALDDARPSVRVAAALGLLAREPDDADETVARVLEEATPRACAVLAALPVTLEANDPLGFVIERLGERWPLQLRLLRTWTRDSDVEVRKNAVFATERVLHAWRPAAEPIVRELARCLSDPERDVRYWAASHLASAGRSARLVSDALWELLEREPPEANSPASFALSALCKQKDPRAAHLVAQALEVLAPSMPGWKRLFAGASSPVELPRWLPVAELGPWAPECAPALVRLVSRVARGNAKITVIRAVGRYGVAAHAAIPAIRAELGDHPHIATRVLGDFGPAAAAALTDLRALARHEDVYVRVNVARALWRIAGLPQAPVAILREAITDGKITDGKRHGRSHALEVVAEMGPAAMALAPLLPPLLDAPDDWVSARAAIALWHVTGEVERTVPVLVERHLTCTPRGREALQCLKDLGPRARPAAPFLERSLASMRRQVENGTMQSWVEDDEQWLSGCEEALRAINA